MNYLASFNWTILNVIDTLKYRSFNLKLIRVGNFYFYLENRHRIVRILREYNNCPNGVNVGGGRESLNIWKTMNGYLKKFSLFFFFWTMKFEFDHKHNSNGRRLKARGLEPP